MMKLLGLFVSPDGSEVRQHPHKVLDHQHLFNCCCCCCCYLFPHLEPELVEVLDCWVVGEHCVDNPVAQRVDPQLRYVDDVLPGQISLPSLVQTIKPVVEPGDLTQGEPGLITGSVLPASFTLSLSISTPALDIPDLGTNTLTPQTLRVRQHFPNSSELLRTDVVLHRAGVSHVASAVFVD